MDELVMYQRENDIGLMTINRPEALNALNATILTQMRKVIQEQVIGEKTKVLILTGSGDKAFVAGADVKEMESLSESAIHDYISLGQEVSNLLEQSSFVSIAAINGYALGGGLEMALACDLIYMCDTAVVGLPEVTIGLMPGFGGTQRLMRTVGVRNAREMIYTGRSVKAADAVNMGLSSGVFPANDLLGHCKKIAGKIAANAFFSVLQAKTVMLKGAGLPMHAGMDLEKHAFLTCFATDDGREGMQAFLGKRKPTFNY